MDNLKNLSVGSQRVFWIIIIAFILIGLYAFFTSRLGQTLVLICCGLIVAIAVVGILSERGMRRPR